METTTRCTEGRWNRSRIATTDGAASVEYIAQANGKCDNVLINFGDNDFDGQVLYNAFQRDQFNVYPYVVMVGVEQMSRVSQVADSFGIADRVITLPSSTPTEAVSQLMYACAASKGASKGFNASKSQGLDKIVLQWVQSFLSNVDVDVICPTEHGGSTNEDIRILKDGKKIYRQENKSISQQCNITERLHMVSGKGLSTGGVYDMFMSFEGFDLKFLDYVDTHAPAHLAKGYVEFSVAEQTAIFKEKAGNRTTLEEKRVMLPVDITDPSKGMVEGPLLRDYITNIVQSA